MFLEEFKYIAKERKGLSMLLTIYKILPNNKVLKKKILMKKIK